MAHCKIALLHKTTPPPTLQPPPTRLTFNPTGSKFRYHRLALEGSRLISVRDSSPPSTNLVHESEWDNQESSIAVPRAKLFYGDNYGTTEQPAAPGMKSKGKQVKVERPRLRPRGSLGGLSTVYTERAAGGKETGEKPAAMQHQGHQAANIQHETQSETSGVDLGPVSELREQNANAGQEEDVGWEGEAREGDQSAARPEISGPTEDVQVLQARWQGISKDRRGETSNQAPTTDGEMLSDLYDLLEEREQLETLRRDAKAALVANEQREKEMLERRADRDPK